MSSFWGEETSLVYFTFVDLGLVGQDILRQLHNAKLRITCGSLIHLANHKSLVKILPGSKPGECRIYYDGVEDSYRKDKDLCLLFVSKRYSYCRLEVIVASNRPHGHFIRVGMFWVFGPLWKDLINMFGGEEDVLLDLVDELKETRKDLVKAFNEEGEVFLNESLYEVVLELDEDGMKQHYITLVWALLDALGLVRE
jgi:hypothetical protein